MNSVTAKGKGSGSKRRVYLALATFFGVLFFLMLGLGLISGMAASHLAEVILPRGPEGGSSIDLGGNLLAVPVLAITGAAIAAAVVWEPNVSSRRECILLVIALLVVGAISWTDYVAFFDTLISLRAQALLDLIMAGVSVAIIGTLWRWEPKRPTTIGIRAVSAFCLTLFGFVIPTYFAVSYVLAALGIGSLGYQSIKDWIDGIGAIFGLVATLLLLKKTKTDKP
jgi:hypothetical protein